MLLWRKRIGARILLCMTVIQLSIVLNIGEFNVQIDLLGIQRIPFDFLEFIYMFILMNRLLYCKLLFYLSIIN